MPADHATTRGWWLRQMRQWHWISSAICLVGMLGFAITGITLNHAGSIGATPERTLIERTVPDAALRTLDGLDGDAPLPDALARWILRDTGIDVGARVAEIDDYEVYLAMPGPGVDAWLAIDRESGALSYERTDRGWIAYFNDLHKGRDSGTAWRWFIDVFAVACVVFCATGLVLLSLYAQGRASTWPLVGLGVVAPLLLLILFIH